jgi:hypothetical protein
MKKLGTFIHQERVGRILPVVWTILAIVLTAGQASAQWASPVASPTTDFTFGMVGIGGGQTARLNIVNVGPATGTSIPCVLALAFFDSNSKIIKQTFISLKSGQAGLLDLTAVEVGLTELKPDSTARVQIRGAGYNPTLIPQPLSCNLVPTVEIFDSATGKTVTVLANFMRPNG